MNRNVHQHPINRKLPARMKRLWRDCVALADSWEQANSDLVSRVNARLNRQRPVPVRVRVEIPSDRRERWPRR